MLIALYSSRIKQAALWIDLLVRALPEAKIVCRVILLCFACPESWTILPRHSALAHSARLGFSPL